MTKRAWAPFIIGAVGYPLVELAFRGRTHWTMALTGGACFWAIYKANAKLKRASFLARCALGAAIITCAELAVGSIVNRRLNWNVWDYSANRFNYRGQICALYSFLWFMLNMALCPLSRLLARRLER